MTSIDDLAYRSKLRHRSPAVKFGYAVATLAICVLSRSAAVSLLTLGANAWLTIGKGGVSRQRWGKFLAVPVAFLVLSGGAILVNLSGEPMDLFAVQLGRVYLTGSRAGLLYVLELTLTALGAVSCLGFLAMTTPMTDLLEVLRRLHCPGILLELMLLIYRYTFILLDSARAIRVAQQSRLGNRTYRGAVRSFGLLGSALFVRSITRARAQYNAMESRCYDGTIRVLEQVAPPEKRDIFCIAAFEILLAAVGIGGKLLWNGM